MSSSSFFLFSNFFSVQHKKWSFNRMCCYSYYSFPLSLSPFFDWRSGRRRDPVTQTKTTEIITHTRRSQHNQHTHSHSHDGKKMTRVERAGATRHGEGHGPTDGLSAGWPLAPKSEKEKKKKKRKNTLRGGKEGGRKTVSTRGGAHTQKGRRRTSGWVKGGNTYGTAVGLPRLWRAPPYRHRVPKARQRSKGGGAQAPPLFKSHDSFLLPFPYGAPWMRVCLCLCVWGILRAGIEKQKCFIPPPHSLLQPERDAHFI